ncbi:unnamed protein product [Meganyctiphanes norvegica]|uniref:Secreted protein n=1 Tax=Meganyctiphanes norvegica TaxID=48144 RepID=A0AAV2S7Y1_MEGNR
MRNISAISLLLLATAGWASGTGVCNCGAFMTTDIGDILIVELPALEAKNCDDHKGCSRACVEEVGSGGDLFAMAADGTDRTNGQALCDEMGKPIDNKLIYGYYELCGGPWEYTGVSSEQALCCDDNGQHQYCQME